MKLDTIIQRLAKKSVISTKDHSEIIKHLLELKASLKDKELNSHLLNSLIEKYAVAERNLTSVNQVLSEKNEQIRKALTERNLAYSQLDKELTGAADYVKTILPQPILEGSVQIDWRFIPSSSLGGDAFGYHWVDENNIAIYLIDVSGHGIRPALLSVSIINALRSQSLPHADFKDPETVLTTLNTAFPSDKNNAMFFTAWYGVYNKSNRKLSFASGGHPPALLLDNSDNAHGELKQLRTPNIVIGALDDSTFIKDTVQTPENSRLYIYSDGVYEIKRSDGSMWRLEEFIEFVSTFKNENPYILDNLIEQIRIINGSPEFSDDFTIMEIIFG